MYLIKYNRIIYFICHNNLCIIIHLDILIYIYEFRYIYAEYG